MEVKLVWIIVCCLALVACLAAGAGSPAADQPEPMQGQAFVPPEPQVMFILRGEADYEPLFKADLSNAIFEEGGWVFEGDVLTAKGKGDIWTKDRFDDFILSLEFKCEADTNSGIFFRCGDLQNWLHTSIEAQILQNNDDCENPRHHCGGIFDCLAPTKQMVKAPGEWNKYVIIAREHEIWLFLNNDLTAYMNLNLWTEPHKNPDGTPNKFNNAYKDMPREGHIGLQYHGAPIWFRNIRFQRLKLY